MQRRFMLNTEYILSICLLRGTRVTSA